MLSKTGIIAFVIGALMTTAGLGLILIRYPPTSSSAGIDTLGIGLLLLGMLVFYGGVVVASLGGRALPTDETIQSNGSSASELASRELAQLVASTVLDALPAKLANPSMITQMVPAIRATMQLLALEAGPGVVMDTDTQRKIEEMEEVVGQSLADELRTSVVTLSLPFVSILRVVIGQQREFNAVWQRTVAGGANPSVSPQQFVTAIVQLLYDTMGVIELFRDNHGYRNSRVRSDIDDSSATQYTAALSQFLAGSVEMTLEDPSTSALRAALQRLEQTIPHWARSHVLLPLQVAPAEGESERIAKITIADGMRYYFETFHPRGN